MENSIEKPHAMDFPDDAVVNTLPSDAEGRSSVPGQETKIPHALQPKIQKYCYKHYCNNFNKEFKKLVHIKKKSWKKKKRSLVPSIPLLLPSPQTS